ncbi:MAG TPA: D-alanyl-D-alanine carboxypeptidase/D-alanyl-D-alanine-endopeptidase [Pyrinomonadaceae bacterium]|jgi:D-alanyl-D-alanine carboxypeptidase/D-alanyl-D-alanine-endopeptidase (penicillin-binding protein 4)|nr:D-alanyl-D-alanine carboxypeptidase/D-alanyl-D-alanine-endopeptidase [Pyrinomonadaceae bacterium]
MIKSTTNRSLITIALIGFTFFAAGSYFVTGVSALQETNQRSRKVSATPTPKQTATPKPTPSVKPTATPTATPAPTATPTPLPVQTLPELQSKIRSILLRPELRRGQVGIKVASLDSGKTMFEENAEKYFMPASNMKIFTVGTALVRLTPDFRFSTSVYAATKPDADGVIKGDLTIYGRGDPSLAAAFNNGDYLKAFNDLADKIVQAGVKRVEGGLVGDESYFTDGPIPAGWEWDDLQWYYGAEVSSLTANDNSIDVTAKPGASVGAIANVTLGPAVPGVTLRNKVFTSAAGAKRDLGVFRPLGQNIFEVTGSIPINDEGKLANVGSVAITRPAEAFVKMLRQVLEQKGVTVTGATRSTDAKERAVASSTAWVEITKLESPPLSVIAANTLKPSQNLYTELILRAMGETIGDKTKGKKNSFQLGVGVVDGFIKQAGVADGSVLMNDASGLSRHDLITPAAVVQFHTYMSRHQYSNIWRDAMPIGGVDGTLKNRLKNPATMNNVRAKTGTLDQVSALSGYLTTASGEKLVFSIMTNAIPSSSLRQSTIDEIVLLLANYNGKSN